MKKKKLGVIGGMGPIATSVFFERIIENTLATKDQEHIDMVILNHATIPDRTSSIMNREEEKFLDCIRKDIKLLEIAEVDNIAIPCNTSHYYYNEMIKMTDINIINMVEETVKAIQNKYSLNSKAALLATKGTINSGVYRDICNKYNIELFEPNETIQQKVMEIIYSSVKGNLEIDSKELENIINHIRVKENCNCIILGCTELSCIRLSEDVSKYCIDAMNVLVKKSIELSGKKIKKVTYK